MVAKKRLEVDLRDGTGRVIKFEVPVNATPTQIGVLAQRAIKQNFPGEQFQRPRLDRPVAQQAKAFDASASATPNSLRNRAGNAVMRGARAIGVNERSATRLGNKAEGIVDAVPVLGEIVGGEDAVTAFKRGNYGEAAVGGVATALGALGPLGDAAAGATKAMFLGARAKTADRAALATAEQMLAAGANRDEVWKATGWGKGADGNWRFETDDSAMSINPRAIPDPDLIGNRAANEYANSVGHDSMMHIPVGTPERKEAQRIREEAKAAAYKTFSRGNKVIDGTPLEEAYPYGFGKLKVGAEDNLRLNGSWNEATSELRVRPPIMNTGLGGADARSTIAHELQHFVQGQEGFARGGMTGTVPAYDVDPTLAPLMSEYEDVAEELALRMDQFPDAPETMRVRLKHDDLKQRIDALKPAAEFEGYKRLAGEVEARNVQKRLDWSPEMRRAVPPWKTQEYADEDQFKIWGGDGAASASADKGRLEEFARDGNERFLRYIDPDGRDGGSMQVIVGDDGLAEISIDPFSKNPNRFGPAQVREGARMLREMYPDIKGVWGVRETGAGPGRTQRADLTRFDALPEPSTPDPLAANWDVDDLAAPPKVPR